MKWNKERRFTGDCELHTLAAEGASHRKITGHAAVFDSLSAELWGFRERIAPGAFSLALGKSDIRALLNHDPNYVLGRTKSGTLRVREDDRGLAVEIDPPDTSWSNDLLVSIDRGDISQMSFAFRVAEDRWDEVDGARQRTIISFDEIFDVSPVTYPAYPDTDVALRTALGLEDIDDGKANAAILKEYERVLRFLVAFPDPGPLDPPAESAQRRQLNQLKRRLHVLELETTL
jgi:uncharacterized protein